MNEAMLDERRFVRQRAGQQLALALGAVVLTGLAAMGSDASCTGLFNGRALSSAAELLSGLLHPDLDAAFLKRVLRLTLESLAIGALGLVGAVTIAVPLALLAARVPGLPDPPLRGSWRARVGAILRGGAKSALAALRAVPEVVWAFLFVRIMGLGAGPAVLAIALTFGGIMGKLYAELIEACAPEPARMLEAAGASRASIMMHAVLPQVRGQWVSYGLFRFECSIRSAAILGVVGAGGLGTEIDLSVRYFQYDRLATALLAVLACVATFELVSSAVRRADASLKAMAAATVVAAVVSSFVVHVPWRELFRPEALRQLQLFAAGFMPPKASSAAVADALRLMLQTLAMATLATVLAGVVALGLAPWASRRLSITGFLQHPPGRRSWGASGFRWAALALARSVLLVSRALPELVWALIFVVWVGPGPFAGALAIAAHTFGILGRLYGEVIEDVKGAAAGPARQLESCGASSAAAWWHAIWPQARTPIAAFTFFRFEVNVRATATVGFVGAGGIGDAIHTSISLFKFSELAVQLIVLLATVVALDALSGILRARLAARG